MSVSLRIGIIGGGGWLGGAIAGSILDSGMVDPQNLCLSHRSEPPRRFPNSFWTTDSQELADRSDVILLSIRPNDWRSLDVDVSGKLVISVMAGIRLAALSERHVVQAFLDHRGTTAAAIEGMRVAGFENAVGDGLSAAFKKSVSMGTVS